MKYNRVMFLTLICTLLLFMLPGVYQAMAQHVGDHKVVERQRSRWVKQQVRQLKKVTAEDCRHILEKNVVAFDGYYRQYYRLDRPSGCILFPDGGWVYLVSHSSHEKKEIGDVTLAIDVQGRIWYNEGHVCGGIIHFVAGHETEVTEAGHFFENFVSDIDDTGWTSLPQKK